MARELSLAYGNKVILDRASFTVGPNDRVGLVGPNGSGKSSLLKILAGVSTPDDGAIQLSRRARVGYLPQELVGLPEGSVIESVLASVPGRVSLEERRDELQTALTRTTDEAEQLELAQQLADLITELDHFDARYGRHRAERILRGLGFPGDWLSKDTSTLSGGWRMRSALGALLLQDPDLLLLDEPTNHLDLPTLTWFDDFLRRSRKALMLISHDRAFLNRQVNRIVSLEVEGLRTYTGNYEEYRRQRVLESGQLKARAEKQQARRAEMEAFIERFGAKATKARQAQSRAKMLEKEEIIEVHQERATVSFSFPQVSASGREVLRVEDVAKSYGPMKVYDGVKAAVQRGQRIAIVGVNGAGKTTLLKIIAGELSPDRGEVAFGHNVIMGYYAQHHADTLRRESSVLDEVQALVPDRPQSYVRGVLGAFLFTGDDVEKRIGVLSGGERARVALAKLLLKPANLMLMDEPTNHLDLDSSEALIEALQGYEGTLLFVSHNRSFLNALATHVWEVKDQGVTEYPGNLDDYLYHLQQQQQTEEEGADGRDPGSSASARPVSEKDRKRAEAELRQQKSRLEGPIKKEIAEIEARIAVLETEQKTQEAQLADPSVYDDFARARALTEAHQAGKAELETLYSKWEDAQSRLEQVAAQLAG